MGMIGSILGILFGGGRNVITQTVGAFLPNAERSAERAATARSAASSEFAAEFYQRRGWFNSLIDGLNRLPRPAMALGTIALFVSAMYNPIWFAARMQGLALVPDQLWWLLGAIVTFYFGARYQAKALNTKAIMARTPQVIKNIKALRKLNFDSPGAADTGNDVETTIAAVKPAENQAIADWNDQNRP